MLDQSHSHYSLIRFISRLECLVLLVCMVICSPPDDPIQCLSKNTDCTITNSYGTFPDRSICRAAEVIYPQTEEELISAVARASREERKVKVTTRYSHSVPKLVCPDGQDGLLISTHFLSRLIEVNASAMVMTVQSGVTLREVIEHAAAAGLALPYTPYWFGLTMGGLLATGAHGSTLWGTGGSAVHDFVVGLKIVTPAGASEGYARIISLDNSSPEMDAAKVSLGVLGVISQVTLKLQPLFKRSITNTLRDDSDLADEVIIFGKKHEFADVTWFPSQRKALYRIDDRVSVNESGNGVYDNISFRSALSAALAPLRSSEELQESTSDANGKCLNSRLTISTLMAAGFGLTNNGIAFTGYPVIGFHNRLQASGSCLDSPDDALTTACAWDPRTKVQFFHQTSITISLTNVKNFINDVQKLRDIEPKAFCGVELYIGILIRYGTASSAYLGRQEESVDFDIAYYRSTNPMIPRLHEDVLEELEQIAVFKYGGTAHWGKNRNVAFKGVIHKYSRAGAFLEVKEKYDPKGLFSNEWTDQILGIQGDVTIFKEGCALEGLCVCSGDIHCSPSKGYVCRPGQVYKDARVCTHESSLRVEL